MVTKKQEEEEEQDCIATILWWFFFHSCLSVVAITNRYLLFVILCFVASFTGHTSFCHVFTLLRFYLQLFFLPLSLFGGKFLYIIRIVVDGYVVLRVVYRLWAHLCINESKLCGSRQHSFTQTKFMQKYSTQKPQRFMHTVSSFFFYCFFFRASREKNFSFDSKKEKKNLQTLAIGNGGSRRKKNWIVIRFYIHSHSFHNSHQ